MNQFVLLVKSASGNEAFYESVSGSARGVVLCGANESMRCYAFGIKQNATFCKALTLIGSILWPTGPESALTGISKMWLALNQDVSFQTAAITCLGRLFFPTGNQINIGWLNLASGPELFTISLIKGIGLGGPDSIPQAWPEIYIPSNFRPALLEGKLLAVDILVPPVEPTFSATQNMGMFVVLKYPPTLERVSVIGGILRGAAVLPSFFVQAKGSAKVARARVSARIQDGAVHLAFGVPSAINKISAISKSNPEEPVEIIYDESLTIEIRSTMLVGGIPRGLPFEQLPSLDQLAAPSANGWWFMHENTVVIRPFARPAHLVMPNGTVFDQFVYLEDRSSSVIEVDFSGMSDEAAPTDILPGRPGPGGGWGADRLRDNRARTYSPAGIVISVNALKNKPSPPHLRPPDR
jgi:hypothetical protein